jgi:hypothetical protein
MLYVVANGVAEDVENHLANYEEEDAERNVAQRPAVLERANNQDDLANHVHEEEDCVDNVSDDKDADRVVSAQTSPVLEGEQRDGAADHEHAERAETQQPDGQCGAILVQLESDEAVDQQTSAEGGHEAILGSSEVRVGRRTGSRDAGVEDERYDCEEEVDVEEGRNLLATCDVCQSIDLGVVVCWGVYNEIMRNIPTAVNFERT